MNLERTAALLSNPLHSSVLSPAGIALLAGMADFEARIRIARHAVAVASGMERV